MTIYESLTAYCSSDAYPFHMPGHKRRAAFLCDPSSIDITEIDGFDNLHHADGILKEAQERAARLYGSQETHFLVNGSTSGVLAAIGACTRPGDCILMARNSHRSAYNAAALNRLTTLYLYPQAYGSGMVSGPIDPESVEAALNRNKDIRAVFLTSPTYDGMVSDIAKIARIAHNHRIPLIVDEAHGAHFGMHPIFPESSVRLGADLVIHSLHKTLPALTQTALIHVNGPLVNPGRLQRLLSVYQTSSPSYVLMASIDQCIHLLSTRGNELFEAYARRLSRFYRETKLASLRLLRTDDPSRILICPAPEHTPDSISSMQLYRILRERFHLQPEMVTPSYVLMLSSVCDDEDGFSRLTHALRAIDREAGASHAPAATIPLPEPSHTPPSYETCIPTDTGCTISQALDSDTEAIAFSKAENRIAAEFLTMYPPGIPLLVPGEIITAGLIRRILTLKEKGYTLTGTEDHTLRMIRVIL